MFNSKIEHEGIQAEVNYDCWSSSYVATIRILNSTTRTSKSFGNGVAAEDWILNELSLGISLLILKYSA